MKRFLSALAILTFVFSSAYAGVKVTTDYDHSKNFSDLKTYALYDEITGSNSTVSSLNANRIITAVRNALNAKGYVEAKANPDFRVNVNAVVQDEQRLVANTNVDGGPYAYGGFYRPYAYWGGPITATTSFDVQDYKDGSLIIDMVDPAGNKLFWEGVGDAEIDGQLNNPDKKIAKAVTKILASFPAVGGKPAVK